MAAAVVHGAALALTLTVNGAKLAYYIWTIMSLIVMQCLNAKYRCKRSPRFISVIGNTPWLTTANAQRVWDETAWITT
ncbi:hypothetical protein QMK32_10645 [Rhodococcus sp. H29-C3]|nr:hypothetical protein [Rhodococcus sp. H29-C3]